MQFTEVATIDKTYERAKINGLGLSKTFIRRHCLDGSLKSVKTGNKYLIYWPNLLRLIENGDLVDHSEQESGKIRRISG